MKKSLQFISLLIMGSWMVSCTAISSSVYTDYDRDAEFENYATYYWSDNFQFEQNGQEPLFYNSLIQKRLKEAVAVHMDGRDYRLEQENPDLLVNTHVTVEEKEISRTEIPYSPFYYGYYPGNINSYTSQYKEGGIVIELIDRERKQLIWQGYVADVFKEDTKNKRDQIQAAVAKIFNEYPYRAKEGLVGVNKSYDELMLNLSKHQ